jgi:hypothetical protein
LILVKSGKHESGVRLIAAIDCCDCFLACFSEHYSSKRSSYINREVEIALERNRRIFPVRLSGGTPDLPYAIRPVGRLLSAMLSGDTVRSAGLAQLTRQFSTAGKNERLEILQNLKYVLDLPEAIELLERGLLDQEESVRFQALALLPGAGDAGVTLARGIFLNPGADTKLQIAIALIYSVSARRRNPGCISTWMTGLAHPLPVYNFQPPAARSTMYY